MGLKHTLCMEHMARFQSLKLKTGYLYENQIKNPGFRIGVRQFCGYQYFCNKILFHLVSSYSPLFLNLLELRSMILFLISGSVKWILTLHLHKYVQTQFKIILYNVLWKMMPGRVKQVPQDSTEWDRTDTGHSTDKHLHVWFWYLL